MNPPQPCCISGEWESGGWINLVFIGLSLIFLSFSLIYMLSKIFSKPEWAVWIKDEFYQAIISVAIVVLLVVVISAVCSIFTNVAGADPFVIAHTYLNGLVWDKTINLATRAFQDSLICQLAAAYKTHVGSKSLGTTYQQSIGLRTVATNFDFLYTLFVGLSASLMVQDIGLSIIQAFAFRIMLPLGILFRVFPFLRRAGATFIALALGLYIVYPLCFVMNQMVVNAVMKDPVMSASFISSSAGLPVVEGFALAIISPFLPWALIDIVLLLQEVAKLLPQAIFLPTLNLVITLTFVKNASRVLSQNFGEG
ncbi:hypothetical protein H0N99_02505 [Candidatus Micrarchaeota archaeon]|nr:hypothetical protein [Candidatus Micrarchaeota archaeon]